MYPYHHHHWRHMGYSRGPSRFIWFAIGAGVATVWHKCHKIHANSTSWSSWGHCHRAAIQQQYPSPLPLSNASTNPDGSPTSTQAQEPSFSFRDIPRRINNLPSAAWEWGQEKERGKNQEEEDPLADLQRQATETMSDMSEAALETIVATAESLRAKLVENREQRRKQGEELKR
ncbi:hypothetical protein AGABI2DRAFT_118783 [Agaricus bisporus var. bisporus H97]|uniref:hypothetical protein n=1 Tax=Agaricus bisporus var. bisporus (strain H97 / ATCC MYA-4626 / FGSC 10389) TaxID=936046 RepID=UPI00029F607C|nr:hypothetical protein AGABI2DRAFT_118783 [Agaricus bisporus var. bisporus H97]EKV46609.1 hypothetical protein AGABI2DRAFT_118783 [Agaricus bisporus var. bisporus H97]